MKGITPIIGVVLLILITITLAGSAYTFLFGIAESATAKTIQLVPGSPLNDTVIVKNIGTSTIQADELRVTVNGQQASFFNPGSIGSKKSRQFRIDSPVYGEQLNVRILGPTNTISYKTDIITD